MHFHPPFEGERALFLERNMFTAPKAVGRLFSSQSWCDPLSWPDLNINGLKRAGFDRLVFANPYSRPKLRALYRECLAENFPILVCERGMLPGTACLDTTGFLADSRLSNVPEETFSKFFSLKDLSDIYLARRDLEKQNASWTGGEVSDADTPKLLIALQDSTDTAVKFFHGDAGNYEKFLQFCDDIARSGQTDYEVSFKPHPREANAIVTGATNCGDHHILDAISNATHVLTFSSGVAVLALLMGRPVAYFGNPLYRSCKACHPVQDMSELEQFLNVEFDENSALLFLNTLHS